jgi:hypothetical protein
MVDGGHLFLLEDPAPSCTLVEDFLREQDAGTAPVPAGPPLGGSGRPADPRAFPADRTPH